MTCEMHAFLREQRDLYACQQRNIDRVWIHRLNRYKMWDKKRQDEH